MSERPGAERSGETGAEVLVRYWAAARAAAGVREERLAVAGEVSLDTVFTQVRQRHRDNPRFAEVLAVCSVLVGDLPVAGRDPRQVVVRPGETVELLPPFAGGALPLSG